MNTPDQFPRRFSRAVPGTAAPPDAAIGDGAAGRIDVAGQNWDAELSGFPPGRDTELLAETGGLLMGRFLLTPGDGRPAVEQRLVAVGLASQAAAALASARLAGHR
jgi:hypothetical protein